MDKEAQEKIASKLAERKELDWGLLTGILQDEFREQATVALQTLAELGYRKPLDRPELRKKAKEIVLGIRQYLCNTEFAPEPFTEPVDLNKLTIEFPNQILAMLDILPKN